MRKSDATLRQFGLTPGGEPEPIMLVLDSASLQNLWSSVLCLTETVYKGGMLTGLLTNTSQES